MEETPNFDQRIREVIALLQAARPMPLSSSVVVNRDEVVAALESMLDDLPEEVRRARWLLKERDEFLESARGEAEAIVEQAARQAEAMVQRSEVVRQAEARAIHVVADAEAEARRHRRETEDWCEQRLEHFDTTLTKVTAAVLEGRQRLRALPRTEHDDVDVRDDNVDLRDEAESSHHLLFDQDEF
ncbi:MAG: ATP synthase F0 subunit B [Actinomycetia bacterium]|nr:ATP synthase F0 subunit B [Actinomycetes bacterium]MCP4963553.1 ATP synthase F0 subunit B [Actinomycetes bacterium]